MSLLIRVSMLSLTHMEKRMRQVVITYGGYKVYGDNVMGSEVNLFQHGIHRAQTATKSMNLGRMCARTRWCTRWLCSGKRYRIERAFKIGKSSGVYIRVYHKGLI